jgi:hypothetical protein
MKIQGADLLEWPDATQQVRKYTLIKGSRIFLKAQSIYKQEYHVRLRIALHTEHNSITGKGRPCFLTTKIEPQR